MIRVVIVDDSRTMRAILRAALSREQDIAVVGEAADPAQARTLIRSHDPDVITLDVEMPGMSGLDFLERLMRLRPMPVVMVASQTARGAESSLRALELGAVECVAKPACGTDDGLQRLPDIIRAAARARLHPARASLAPARPRPAPMAGANNALIAIGASTGGVEALLTIVAGLPAAGPPVAIVQHMPSAFVPSLVRRLDRAARAHVTAAEDDVALRPGMIVLAPGDAHLEIAGSGQWRCRVTTDPPVNGHRPSIDVLFASVARAAGRRAVGVILTGMGRDGAAGLLAMRQAGARTLGQDAASSIVYGMPRAAHALGAVETQAPLGAMAEQIVAAVAQT